MFPCALREVMRQRLSKGNDIDTNELGDLRNLPQALVVGPADVEAGVGSRKRRLASHGDPKRAFRQRGSIAEEREWETSDKGCWRDKETGLRRKTSDLGLRVCSHPRCTIVA